MSGARSYHAGRMAEERVAAAYERAGHKICARRWRGKSGEIDLIARDGAALIFIEVKQSRSHAMAAESLSGRQMSRICSSAQEFIGREPAGQDTVCRFDLALVDQVGRVDILENAFAA